MDVLKIKTSFTSSISDYLSNTMYSKENCHLSKSSCGPFLSYFLSGFGLYCPYHGDPKPSSLHLHHRMLIICQQQSSLTMSLFKD